MRSRGVFFYTNLGFSRRRYSLHLDDQNSCCHKSLKNTQAGVLVAGGNPRKKESMDLELERGRVSKFYWLVALGSRAWVLVSPFV